MATLGAVVPGRTVPVGDDAVPVGTARAGRAFLAWGVGSYLVVLAALLVSSLRATGGHLVYVLDDPAIHMSVAKNLAEHGTWGVVPGHFESASSSPLWTVLLAGWYRLAPGHNIAPLVLNVAAGLAVVALLASAAEGVLRPGRRRPFDAVAVGLLVVVVLFLPGLAMVGMEHSLHAALVLGAVVLLHRRSTGADVDRPQHQPEHQSRVRAWLPFLLIALATLTRFETAFVAAGIGLALVMLGRPRRSVLGVVLASGLPLAGFALVNHLLGQGFLPNSIIAKTRNTDEGDPSALREIADRFTQDPYVALLAAVFLVALLFTWQRRPTTWPAWTFPAVVYLVAVALHVCLARMGWYERYQAYLVVLGVYALLVLLEDVLTRLGPEQPEQAGSRSRRPTFAAAVIAIGVLFAASKAFATVNVSEAASETYLQRYQAALFLKRYYQDQPVATGELGYISLLHDGPVTDLFGLGDHEVLQERLRSGQNPSPDYWGDLLRRRDVDVVAAYPTTLFFDTPEDWILVGTWEISEPVISAWESKFGFWATQPEAVAPLVDHLREFETALPEGVTVDYNPSAGLQAMAAEANPSD